MNKFTALLIFSLFTSIAWAQPSGLELNFQRVRSGDRFVSDGNTTGSPYYHGKYHSGSIYLNDELAAAGILLKYNAYRDIFFAVSDLNTPDEDAQIVTKTQGMRILVNNEEFITLPSLNNRYEMQNYQVVVRGKKITLLKKNYKLFVEGSRATTSLTRDVPSTYSDRSDFYFLSPSGDFTEVPSSTRKVLALFPEDKKALSAAVKKYSLNLKKEIDLIRFIGYYNRL